MLSKTGYVDMTVTTGTMLSVIDMSKIGKLDLHWHLPYNRKKLVRDTMIPNHDTKSISNDNIPPTDPLEVVVNPVDKPGLVGDTITLCCQAEGDPPPDYYEWY